MIGRNRFKTSSENVTVDLPASTSDPYEIDCTSPNIVNVEMWVHADFHITTAENSTDGATRIAADATRSTIKSGYKSHDTIGENRKIYVRSQGSALVSGLSYQLNEV